MAPSTYGRLLGVPLQPTGPQSSPASWYVAAHRAASARPLATPTNFPCNVLQLEGTLSDDAVYASRERRCDLGHLRELYRRDDGKLGHRCPGEPVDDYLRKGGAIADTRGRKCICNGLVTGAGMAQWRDGREEPAILTSGDDVRGVSYLLGSRPSYSAADVLDWLSAC